MPTPTSNQPSGGTPPGDNALLTSMRRAKNVGAAFDTCLRGIQQSHIEMRRGEAAHAAWVERETPLITEYRHVIENLADGMIGGGAAQKASGGNPGR